MRKGVGVASLLVFLVAGLASAPATADDLLILSAAAARKPLESAPRAFQAQSGNTIRFVYGTAGEMTDKALSGPFDVVIVPPARLSDLVKRGVVVAGSRDDLGVVRLAAAVRSGAKAPDIASEAAFKTALLQAPSIAMADPATGATTGIYFAKLMKKLGIADAIKAKTKLYPDGAAAMEAVARGDAAIGLGQKSEIMPVPGVRLIGDLPQAVQLETIYAAGLATRSARKPSALALMRFLRSAPVKAAFLANGFDPR